MERFSLAHRYTAAGQIVHWHSMGCATLGVSTIILKLAPFVVVPPPPPPLVFCLYNVNVFAAVKGFFR